MPLDWRSSRARSVNRERGNKAGTFTKRKRVRRSAGDRRASQAQRLDRLAHDLAPGAPAASCDALRSRRLYIQFDVVKAGILERALVAPVAVD